MDTLAAPIKSFNLQEPIPGYHLRERIGAGGYGEVWLADAPGELTKAVKIVYGPLSAQRAESELKALQRIKQVQHPLLLSLERYEIVDEHLIIVTELAHGSLKDRFDEHVEAGHRGIPRAELLAYLRDVADALDYLYEKHSLQHLDVKPENLLLIADRVKVADFGLVKDLQDQSQSLIGGLTPLYAPPEVFDGRPNQHSDQYSLAIVYQELLTGEPPFAGRTVAQLAAQHLHSNPCLSALPKLDQPIVARALSKDPARRFPNCRKLIDSLSDAHRTTHRPRSAAASTRLAPEPSGFAAKTVMLGVEPIAYPVAPEVRWLDPIGHQTDQATLQPSIFIGVGGFAGQVLQQVRHRLCERFGDIDTLPAFQMLLIDTDPQMLAKAAQGDRRTALRGNQLLPIPLRQPSDYRNDSGAILEWLNRRWLYNIPRSLLTEGIRPLGRLAFVDHYAKISEALHQSIASATTDEALETSSQNSGVSFHGPTPRVFVIGTSSGGTSGGCVLDLGYALRAILGNLGLNDTHLYGLLAHGIPRNAKARDLAVANTLGLLNEYRRYTSSDGYPGEPACGLPASPGGMQPFDHTYFASLGEDVSGEVVPAEARLAEYVYQASAGQASTVLDDARQAPEDESRDPGSLRTLGIHRIGGTSGEFVATQADAICRRLISQWAGRTSKPGGDAAATQDVAIVELARKFSQSLDLRIDRIIGCATDAVNREVRGDTQSFFRRKIAELRGNAWSHESRDDGSAAREICQQIDALLFPTSEQQECLQQSVQTKLRYAAKMKVESLQDWLALLVDARQTRVAGARAALSWICDYLGSIDSRLQQELATAETDPRIVAVTADDESLEGYAEARLRQLILHSAIVFARVMKAEAERSGDVLYEFSTRLQQMKNEFSDPTIDDDSLLPALADVSRKLRVQRRELTEQLDRKLAPALVNKEIPLSALMTAGSDVWMRLVSTMRAAATTLVGGLITRLQVAAAVDDGGTSEAALLPEQAAAGAKPDMLDCGGAARFLLIAPDGANEWPENWQSSFAAAMGAPPTVILDSGESITVCCEVEDVPLQNVVVKVAGGRSDFYKVAMRLQTRIDVEWPSIAEWAGGDTE